MLGVLCHSGTHGNQLKSHKYMHQCPNNSKTNENTILIIFSTSGTCSVDARQSKQTESDYLYHAAAHRHQSVTQKGQNPFAIAYTYICIYTPSFTYKYILHIAYCLLVSCCLSPFACRLLPIVLHLILHKGALATDRHGGAED